MLILRCTDGAIHRRSAHLIDNRTLGPLCGALLRRPDVWEIALVWPPPARLCVFCFEMRWSLWRVW